MTGRGRAGLARCAPTLRVVAALDVQIALSASGEIVAECELAGAPRPVVEELVRRARDAGAARVWVHAADDLAPFGMTRVDGYRRFTGEVRGPHDPLPRVHAGVALDVVPRLFVGQWGHREPNPEWVRAPDAVWVGLERSGTVVGLARVEPARRSIDGPGVLPRFRSPAVTAELLRGAFAVLGEGHVTVESWGDPVAGYLDAGLELAEEVPGWELAL